MSDLREDIFDDVTVDIGQPEVTTFITVREFLVIQPKEMENRRVEIVKMHAPLDGLETEVVSLTVGKARFYTAARHPGAEALLLVLPAVLLQR